LHSEQTHFEWVIFDEDANVFTRFTIHNYENKNPIHIAKQEIMKWVRSYE
jgi:hypothetical protein